MPRWSTLSEREGGGGRGCKSRGGINTHILRDESAKALLGSIDGQESEPPLPPLDPAPVLPSSLDAARRYHMGRVERELQHYDESKVYPRPQDNEYLTRHGYELHVRGRAVAALRRSLKKEVAEQTMPAGGRPHVIILALLPVHIVVEGRLDRLRHTLRTIQQQEALPVDCELVLSVSWYALPALAWEVQGLLAELVKARKGPEELPYAVACSHSHMERSIETTTCWQSWGWGRSQPRHRGRRWGQRRGASQHFSVLLDEAHTPGYSARALQALEEPHALTVVVRQREKKSQFEHLQAALRAAESALRQRWASQRSGATEVGKHSIWVMFGDDDDLWHPRRVATYVHAIQAHPLLVGVGVFVSMARANVERDELLHGEFLPTTPAQVDEFLETGRATLNSEEKESSSWLEERRAAGKEVASLLVPDGLDLEYFDFCPRLRIFNEFFETVSPSLPAHRFCDLRFSQFLMRYNATGRELGMEVCFVESPCWLYFYAYKGPKEAEWEGAIEDDRAAAAAKAGIGEGAHVSTQVWPESCDVELAKERLEDFAAHDGSVTLAKLSRYFAHFRFTTEMRLIREHRHIVDQRDFDDLLVESCNFSFLHYTDRIIADHNVNGEKLMVEVCSSYARQLAERLEVGILWHRPGELLVGPKQQPSPAGSGDEETGGLSGEEFLTEDSDDASGLLHISSKDLAKWAKHEAANTAIRSFILESELGESDALGFGDVLRLLRGVGVPKESLVKVMPKQCSAGVDVDAAVVNFLRKLAPQGRESDILDFHAMHQLLAMLGFTPRQFAAQVQNDGNEEKEALTKCPKLSGHRVLREICTGLGGSVFLYEHTASGRKVALKWPVRQREVTIMKRIERKAGCSAGLPRMLASGKYKEASYFVTELLGSNLQRVFECIAGEPLENRWDIVRLLGRMVLRRLEAVHHCGYVHCDVAPHNLLIGRSGDGLCPYLIDFGCTKHFPGGGNVGADCGSMEYSSVRSADGGERRPEEDLEALGWAMVNGVCGELPWFKCLNGLYDLKPALQKVKLEDVVQRVKQKKANLLDKGWRSLGLDWEELAHIPCELHSYLQLCRAPGTRLEGGTLDYRAYATLLGQERGLDPTEVEKEDSQRLRELLAPFQQWARP